MAVFLGIDIGTSGTKTIAIDDQGKLLAEASVDYPLHQPRPLWSEQDPEDWWRGTVQSVQRVVQRAGLKPESVRAIGLSGQMHGSVFLDKNQRVLRSAILWNDQRTAAECIEIEEHAGGRRKLIGLVANPALTGFTAPKILWLRKHEPRNYEKTWKVLLPKDEIRRRLTGELATDVSDASGTLLLDVKRRTWSKTLLSKLDLDPTLLCPCYESEQVTGTLTPEVAELLGLSRDCLVVAGAGDCAAGAVGNGIVGRGVASTSLGTSGVVFLSSDEPIIDPLGRLHTFCHAVHGKWHLMGVNLSAGGALEWFRQKFYDLAPADRTAAYQRLEEEARAIAPGSQGLLFLPYLTGERTPHADPDARGALVGLNLAHGRGHVARAIMEGVSYALRESLEIMGELELPIRQIRATGGGAKSPLWLQIQADVFGRKVTSTAADEGAAYGAALLAAVGGGAYGNIQEACRATTHITGERVPNAKAKRTYQRAFPVYRQLYQSLKDDFKRIAKLEAF